MKTIQERITDSFQSQGLMTTLGARIVSIAEFKINLMRPAIGERFIAIGKVLNSGKLLTVCTGEAQAFSGSEYKVIAVMQATIVNVRIERK